MSKDNGETPVIFRVWKTKGDDKILTTAEAMTSIPRKAKFAIFDGAGRFLGDVFAVSADDAIAIGRDRGLAAASAKR